MSNIVDLTVVAKISRLERASRRAVKALVSLQRELATWQIMSASSRKTEQSQLLRVKVKDIVSGESLVIETDRARFTAGEEEILKRLFGQTLRIELDRAFGEVTPTRCDYDRSILESVLMELSWCSKLTVYKRVDYPVVADDPLQSSNGLYEIPAAAVVAGDTIAVRTSSRAFTADEADTLCALFESLTEVSENTVIGRVRPVNSYADARALHGLLVDLGQYDNLRVYRLSEGTAPESNEG